MNVTKAPNTNFSHFNDKPKTGLRSSDQKTNKTTENIPDKIDSRRQLVTTQATEYKRFINTKQFTNNSFLAQYIHQVSGQKRRAFIGRKPAWQAKISYQNSENIVKEALNSRLDAKI